MARDEVNELRARPWAAHVDLPARTLHLTFDNAVTYGLAPDALVDDDWAACRQWVARQQDLEALVVPSAALPGTENLVLFGPKLRVLWDAEVTGLLDVRAEPIANVAEVVTDLLPYVRWRGTPHAGLEAWRKGEPQPRAPRLQVSRAVH